MEHLYVHLPFCESRCDYCDFFSQAGGLELAPAYVEAILSELDQGLYPGENLEWTSGLEPVSTGRSGISAGLETVYLGGGTPTMLGGELLEKILAAVAGYCLPSAEITVEANPSTVSRELAESLAEAGVNRVSLGAQSFTPELRRNLGRRGEAAMIAEAVAAFRASGIDNIGLDLMFGIPGQDRAALEFDLESVLALEPAHVSCYELTVKEGSRFQRRWLRGLQVAARYGREFYEMVAGTLEGAGFRWYETSNFARPGYECRHNLAYWQGDDFIGLGAGAWSTVEGRRWHNVEDLAVYLDCASRGDWEAARTREELSSEVLDSERMMLGLRRDVGVERAAVAGAIDTDQEKLLLRNGFLVNEGGRISLTRQGRFVANEVCARLLRD
ncbi:MAG: radical SAM family heme chaperone HemW [Actinobacteria bacterium]|nr:radical SAM family heme chaperone HemW [Actinomycetota bacterium]